MISIKIKVLVVLLAVIVAYGMADFVFHRFVIFSSFLELEKEEAAEDMERVVQAFKRETAYLDSLCHDWASWNDTYEFILDGSQEYIAGNLQLASFSDNRVNLVYYIDLPGNVVWGEIRDLKTLEEINVPEFPRDKFAPNHPLTRFEADRKELGALSVSGIYRTSKGPMLVAARPILASANKGPIRGTMVMGRFIGKDTVQTQSFRNSVGFKFCPSNFVLY